MSITADEIEEIHRSAKARRVPVGSVPEEQRLAKPRGKQMLDLKSELVGLVLQAANPHPGRDRMPGYAVDPFGNHAKLVDFSVVHLFVKQKDGGDLKYEVVIPETLQIEVTPLED